MLSALPASDRKISLRKQDIEVRCAAESFLPVHSRVGRQLAGKKHLLQTKIEPQADRRICSDQFPDYFLTSE